MSLARRLRGTLLALATLSGGGNTLASAAEPIRILAAGSLGTVLPKLIAASGVSADTVAAPTFGPAGVLRDRLLAGETADLFASADTAGPPAMLKQMEQAGLAVVAVSLSHGEGVEVAKLNASFADDDAAYAQGLQEGVRLIGSILGQDARAGTLLDTAFEGRHLVEQRVGTIPAAERLRLYMANPQLNTYRSGNYTGVIMQRSGGINVAHEMRGAVRVSMEDVLRWDPQVISVQNCYASVANEIRTGAAWQGIAAVQAGRILIALEYVKPWGYPLPKALALGELWMARALYPDRFADIDMQARVDAFYRRFYGVAGTKE